MEELLKKQGSCPLNIGKYILGWLHLKPNLHYDRDAPVQGPSLSTSCVVMRSHVMTNLLLLFSYTEML